MVCRPELSLAAGSDGAAQLDGKMIDRPVVLQAEARAHAAAAVSGQRKELDKLRNDAQAALRAAFDTTGLANPTKVLPSPAACGDAHEVPEGLWVKCDSCSEIIYFKELERNLHVCMKCGHHFKINSRQYARILRDWVTSIGLEPSAYGTHSMRRTKVAQIYKKTGNLRACQLLLGHRKLESTVRYLGIEVDEALELSEQIDL